MFVTNDMLEMIVIEPMNYSIMKHGVAIKLNKDDLEQFIFVYNNMGLVKMPDVHCYWDAYSRYPPVTDVMSRAKFQQIQTRLHFANNELVTDDQKKDRAWKHRPWIENLRTNFQSVSRSEQQSVDEIMVVFKGRSILKQYMPVKPNKWGFKVWSRCSSTGFLHDFDIYQGRGTGIDGDNKDACGLGGKVVLQLCKSITSGPNYNIFADNYFSSFRMVEELMKQGFHYVGTIRGSRLHGTPLVSEADRKKQGRGSMSCVYKKNRNIVLVRWFDNKSVTLISSYVGLEPTSQVQRYNNKKTKNTSTSTGQPLSNNTTPVWDGDTFLTRCVRCTKVC